MKAAVRRSFSCEDAPGASGGSQSLPSSAVDAHIGERLRRRRTLIGMNQAQLGAAIGVTVSQVQKYESGSARLFVSRLHLLAQFLGVDVSFFFEGLPRARASVPAGPTTANPEEVENLVDAFFAIASEKMRRQLLGVVTLLAEENDKKSCLTSAPKA